MGKPSNSNTNIVKAAKGITGSSYGYKWMYKRDYEKLTKRDK